MYFILAIVLAGCSSEAFEDAKQEAHVKTGKINEGLAKKTDNSTLLKVKSCEELTKRVDWAIDKLQDLKSSLKEDSMKFYNNYIYKLTGLMSSKEFMDCNYSEVKLLSRCVSPDKKLILCSWNSEYGGTMRAYASSVSYNTDSSYHTEWVRDLINTDTLHLSETDYICFEKINEIKANDGKIIYLAYGSGLADTHSPWRKLIAYELNNGLKEIHIFPGKSSVIFYSYDLYMRSKGKLMEEVKEIEILENGNKIRVPEMKHGKITGKFNMLVFNGTNYEYKE